MASTYELVRRHQRIVDGLRSLAPDDAVGLSTVARLVARQLRDLESDVELWNDIEAAGAMADSVGIEVRMLARVDWQPVLQQAGYTGPPSAELLALQFAEAAAEVLHSKYRPHRDLLDLVRNRIRALALAIDPDVPGRPPEPDLRSKIGIGVRAAKGLTFTKILLGTAKEVTGSVPKAVGGIVRNSSEVAILSAAGAPLLIAAGIGMAKNTIDAFGSSVDQVRDADRSAADEGHRTARQGAVDHLHVAADFGQLGLLTQRVRHALDLLGAQQDTAASAESVRANTASNIAGLRTRISELAVTIAVLWDLNAPVVGGDRCRALEYASETLATASSHLAVASAALDEPDFSGVVNSANDALRELSDAMSAVYRVVELYPKH